MLGGFTKFPEALKDLIATQDFGETISVERRTVIIAHDDSDSLLRCFVVPISDTVRSGTRAKSGHDWTLGVFVLEKLNVSNAAEKQAREDELLLVVDKIHEFVDSNNTLTVEGEKYSMSVVTDDSRIPVDPEAYIEARSFVGFFTVVVKEG